MNKILIDEGTVKMALDALEPFITPNWAGRGVDEANAAYTALEALAEQPAQQALDKMAENARELGLDYEPSAGTQVSKVWWDGEKLMAEPIDPTAIYQEPEQEHCQCDECKVVLHSSDCAVHSEPAYPKGECNCGAQRAWVGLTDEEVVYLKMLGRDLEFVSMTALRRFARDIQQSLKEKNT